MKRLAIVANDIIHKFIYSGYINGFDAELMEQHGGWMADLHRGGDGLPINKNVRITSIVSADAETAGKIALVSKIETIAETINEQILENCDGALILERDGTIHLELAKPFLQRGKFVYLDKPAFTSTQDANKAQTISETTGAVVIGGSALRYSDELACIKSELWEEPPLSVMVTGPGPWLEYACHMVEVLTVLLGTNIVNVGGVGSSAEGVVTIKWASGLYGTVQFGPKMSGFTVYATYPTQVRRWTIDNGNNYYRNMAAKICSVIESDSHDAWNDISAVVNVLERGTAFFIPLIT